MRARRRQRIHQLPSTSKLPTKLKVTTRKENQEVEAAQEHEAEENGRPVPMRQGIGKARGDTPVTRMWQLVWASMCPYRPTDDEEDEGGCASHSCWIDLYSRRPWSNLKLSNRICPNSADDMVAAPCLNSCVKVSLESPRADRRGGKGRSSQGDVRLPGRAPLTATSKLPTEM